MVEEFFHIKMIKKHIEMTYDGANKMVIQKEIIEKGPLKLDDPIVCITK